MDMNQYEKRSATVQRGTYNLNINDLSYYSVEQRALIGHYLFKQMCAFVPTHHVMNMLLRQTDVPTLKVK